MYTVSTPDIRAIISRHDLLHAISTNEIDPTSLVLISIAEPIYEHYTDEALTDEQVAPFLDSIRVRFWDIEEDFPPYTVIPDSVAQDLQSFILSHLAHQFIIHCRAGVSRSAGVGKAIECIKHFGIGEEAVYLYSTSFASPIDIHPRYHPNHTVFRKLTHSY